MSFTIDDDQLGEKCGVFGVIGHADAAAHCVLGLHALQHRGQEAAGIVTTDGDYFYQHTAFGRVGDNFNSEEVVSSLKGSAAIGHNRYSTSGDKARLSNIQPLFAEMRYGALALAHNGNLTNAQGLRNRLVKDGSIFRTTMDTEVIIHLIATSKEPTTFGCINSALKKIEGGFAMVVLDNEMLVGARDPHGIRPLVLGQLDGAYMLASETCAFDIIGAEYVRDIEPGEVVKIHKDTMTVESSFPFEKQDSRFCIFEYVYFSRPDSQFEGKPIYSLRRQMGRELAKEKPVEADIVVPVPDSGVAAALGFSDETGLPFELGIIRNHYVGRTFIEPSDKIRHLGVKLKHNANRGILEGKRVVLVDDSIVRGTTSKKIVEMVRAAGAKEVHMRISCPPTTDPCFYGVDTPAKKELLAAKMSVEEISALIGVDSLGYLSVDGMYRAVGEEQGRKADTPQYCDACFTGEYPVDPEDSRSCTEPMDSQGKLQRA